MKCLYLFLLLVFGVMCRPVIAERWATATAQIKASVVAPITLTKLRDLDFGDGFTGDPALTLAPQNGAAFLVMGQPARGFHIMLPQVVTLVTGDGSTANKRMDIQGFLSQPVSPGRLSILGSATLFVGATRPALPTTQQAGAYTGTFTVTVTYE